MGGRGSPLADHQRCHPPPILGGPYSGLVRFGPQGGHEHGWAQAPTHDPTHPPLWWVGRMPLVGGIRMAFTALRRQLFPEGKFRFEESKLKEKIGIVVKILLNVVKLR